ncbi:MAG: CPBP family intramembrane glutamic endopeptidase [Microthrixaceae bacterium]
MGQRSLRSETQPRPTEAALARLGWLAALWLGSRVIAGLLVGPFIDPEAPLTAGRLVLSQLPFWAATVAGLVWMARREAEPMGRFVRWGFAPGDAVVGLAAGFGLHWGVDGLYRVLDAIGVRGDASASARELVEASPGWAGRTLLLAMVVVGAPVVEELYYRGVAQRTAVELGRGTDAPGAGRAWGAGVGLVGVAAFFAISHVNKSGDLIQVPGLVLVGLVLGLLVWRSGRIGPSIVAHGVFNLCSLLVLWDVSSPFLAG